MTTRRLFPSSYGAALEAPGARPLLAAVAVSYLGDGMSAVTIAWLAIQIAPAAHASLFIGSAVAAYGLPTVVGTFALGRFLHRRSARTLVILDSAVRTILLAAIAVLLAADAGLPASTPCSARSSARGIGSRLTRLSARSALRR